MLAISSPEEGATPFLECYLWLWNEQCTVLGLTKGLDLGLVDLVSYLLLD